MSAQNQGNQPQVLRGILAGVAGGLAAAWVMNQFMAGPAKKLKEVVQSDEQNFMDQIEEVAADPNAPKEDATMIAADKIAKAVTGNPLSQEQKEKAGPVVHYTFGALMGGIYGGLAEGAPIVTTGLGTTFGGTLFGAADMLAVPALKLSPAPTNTLSPALVSPFAAHLVYGVTTELVRRLVRRVL